MLPESSILVRLWDIMELISSKDCNIELLSRETGISQRLIKDGLHRLKTVGIPIKYRRKTGSYHLNWPIGKLTIDLTPKALFLLRVAMASMGEISGELDFIKTLTDNQDSLVVEDQLLSYGLENAINHTLKGHFDLFHQAKQESLCITFLYNPVGKAAEIRTVEPFHLYRTPISWYLIAFCIERQDFRSFKLARMEHPKLTRTATSKRPFNLKTFLGDAWWIQKGDTPIEVTILFTGEAAKSILEYKFHSSQSHELNESGTLVSWKLSYLGEFLSWLLQWLGSFQVIRPLKLNEMIDQRYKDHSKRTN